MKCFRCLLLVNLLACGVLVGADSPLFAQRSGTRAQADEPSADELKEARQKRLMPKPLDMIESNLRDLEQNGMFSIVSGSRQIINNGQDQAIVWNVRANRPLTCRYIVMQVNAMSDVRLYKTLGAETKNPSLHEVHSMQLYYSPQLDDRASNSSLFARDDIFRIWVYLDEVEARKIRGLSADRAIFRAPKVR